MRRQTLAMQLATVAYMMLAAATLAATPPQGDGATRQPAAPTAQASAPVGQGGESVVPRLIQFIGVVKDATGKVMTGSVSLTFSLYELQEGGSPLWAETQKTPLDDQGQYTVLLGATQPDGLPLDLFTSGKARWLGVQPQLPGAGELPRVLLVGVPYALKAADADTLGGKPASAYVTTESQPAGSASESAAAAGQVVSQAMAAGAAVAQAQNQPAPLSVGGSGTTNYIPIWTNSTSLGNSTLFQTSGNVGIGNTSPAAKLDVSGSATVRGTLALPALGTATSSAGFDSQPLDSLASAYNSGNNAAVGQHFRWQAEPVGNNTSSPSGKLNLLFASGGATPAETGLSLSATGNLTGKQLISNVATGTAPLVVSSTTQVTNLNASQLGGLGAGAFAKVGSANTFTGNQSVTGNVSVTKQLISTVATGTAPLSVKSTTQVANLNASFLDGFSTSAFAFVGRDNTFVPNQSFDGNSQLMIVGDPGCGSGFAAIGFGALSGCNNYSLLGDGTSTYINRPTGGEILFREGNADQMTIASGGAVTMTTATSDAYALHVTSSAGSGGQILGGTDSSGIGGLGLLAVGGDATLSGFFGGDGIQANPGNGPLGQGHAGLFVGDVDVTGNLSKGGGSFKIDHPLDPANKYLYHSFVESPDMMNIYNGNVALDANGRAVVQLPDWFGALNRDFRYQLTCIGGFAPVYVAEEISSNRFKIAGGKPGMKVSWQVTGIRQDAWANAHRIPVGVDKPERERGFYIHPELYGAPEEKSIEWARHPEMMKRVKERRSKLQPRLAKP